MIENNVLPNYEKINNIILILQYSKFKLLFKSVIVSIIPPHTSIRSCYQLIILNNHLFR